MSKRDDKLLVEDIIESADKINEYTANLEFKQFLEDNKTIDAVIRNFEIIGEASSRLSDEFKSKNQSIDWIRLKGFRNRVVHEYFGIDLSIVWEIKQVFLPELIILLKKI